ncbi:MAG: DUF559 domain-containing protein [Candidatus Thiodiazotropha sp.]
MFAACFYNTLLWEKNRVRGSLKLAEHASRLRRNITETEQIRHTHHLDCYKFRHQMILKACLVDFICVEVDDGGQQSDLRTNNVYGWGLCVLVRIWENPDKNTPTFRSIPIKSVKLFSWQTPKLEFLNIFYHVQAILFSCRFLIFTQGLLMNISINSLSIFASSLVTQNRQINFIKFVYRLPHVAPRDSDIGNPTQSKDMTIQREPSTSSISRPGASEKCSKNR